MHPKHLCHKPLAPVYNQNYSTVLWADTLDQIAKQFGVDAQTLCALNELKSCDDFLPIRCPQDPNYAHQLAGSGRGESARQLRAGPRSNHAKPPSQKPRQAPPPPQHKPTTPKHRRHTRTLSQSRHARMRAAGWAFLMFTAYKKNGSGLGAMCHVPCHGQVAGGRQVHAHELLSALVFWRSATKWRT
jgi:hypothetical protein